jgi:hypothetical protein
VQFPLAAVAGLALSTVSEIAAHQAQSKAAKANTKAAVGDYRRRLGDINSRRAEESEASRLDISQARTLSFVEQGMSQLSFAENGVAGNTPAVAQNTLAAGFSAHKLTALANLSLTNKALDRAAEGAEADMHNRIASVQRPSLAATGLRLAGHAVGYKAQRTRQKE